MVIVKYLLITLRFIFIALAVLFSLALLLSIINLFHDLDNFEPQPNLIWTFVICIPIFLLIAFIFGSILRSRGDYYN